VVISDEALRDTLKANARREKKLASRLKTREVQERRRTNKVQVVTAMGCVLAVYESASEAERRTGATNSHISAVCLGKQSVTKGLIFRHADADAELNQLSYSELMEAKERALERGEDHDKDSLSTQPKKVLCVTSKGHVLAVYKSTSEAERQTGISNSHISKVRIT